MTTKEHQVRDLLSEIAELRIVCPMYVAQMDHDNLMRGQGDNDKKARAARWNAAAAMQQQVRNERIARDQARAQQQQAGLLPAYAAQFMPAGYAQLFAAAAAAPAAAAPVSALHRGVDADGDDV